MTMLQFIKLGALLGPSQLASQYCKKSTRMDTHGIRVVLLVELYFLLSWQVKSAWLPTSVCHREREVGLAMVSDALATRSHDCQEENVNGTGGSHDQVTGS